MDVGQQQRGGPKLALDAPHVRVRVEPAQRRARAGEGGHVLGPQEGDDVVEQHLGREEEPLPLLLLLVLLLLLRLVVLLVVVVLLPQRWWVRDRQQHQLRRCLHDLHDDFARRRHGGRWRRVGRSALG